MFFFCVAFVVGFYTLAMKNALKRFFASKTAKLT
jgi:hypothetical protein